MALPDIRVSLSGDSANQHRIGPAFLFALIRVKYVLILGTSYRIRRACPLSASACDLVFPRALYIRTPGVECTSAAGLRILVYNPQNKLMS